MKRILWMMFLCVLGFSMCACGKTEIKQKEQVAEHTEAPIKAVSGSAVTEEPTSTPISEQDAYVKAEDMVSNMTLEQKVGQMFLVDLYQLDKKRTLDGTARRVTKAMAQSIKKYNIGGVYLTEVNMKSRKQSEKLIQDLQGATVSGGGLYVAVEEEGGGSNSISARVAGLSDTAYIAPKEMGKDLSSNQVYQAGKNIGDELTPLGINLNLAPVADIGNVNNPEYAERCLGTDTEQVSDTLGNYVKGMRDGGLAITLKYFPGMGNVSGDFTEKILENTDSLMSLRDNNFEVYQSGIDAGADCVMVGNAAFTEVTVKKTPAFMSQDIVIKLLREELNFNGVIMTSPFDDNVIRDYYSCEFATVEAVKAGCDMIVLPGELERCYNAILSAVKKGKIDEKKIDLSVCRILQNKIQRGILVCDDK